MSFIISNQAIHFGSIKPKQNDFTKINAKIHIQTINSDYGSTFNPVKGLQFGTH